MADLNKRRRGSDHEDEDGGKRRGNRRGSDQDEVPDAFTLMKQKSPKHSVGAAPAGHITAGAGTDSEDEAAFENVQSVVKVFCTHCEPNYALPWTTRSQNTSTSTGWVVRHRNNRWICTNAHSVDDAAVVEIRKRGDDKRYIASVVCIGADCDLALLKVEDASFWKATPDCPTPKPVKIRRSCPRLREEVTVVGYPVGGDNLSVTKGVVSRVDLQDYSNGSGWLLAVQIDAAINPGNSGGPVYDQKNYVVGVAFQTLDGEETENLGYIIPTEVLIHFLEDYYRHSRYTGFGDIGFQYQKLENAALRNSLKMKKGLSGVLVKKTSKVCDCSNVLKAGDVIVKMSGKRVGNDGTVTYRGGERIPFTYLATCKYIGDILDVEYYREGQLCQSAYKVSRAMHLVPSNPPSPPEYLVVGGLVMIPLTEKYLKCSFGETWQDTGPFELVNLWGRGSQDFVDEQVIIVTQVLASPVTVGYQDICNENVKTFNGTKIRNLRHLSEMTNAIEDGYMEFGLASEDKIVLNAKEAKQENSNILQKNMINSDRRLEEPFAATRVLDDDTEHDDDRTKSMRARKIQGRKRKEDVEEHQLTDIAPVGKIKRTRKDIEIVTEVGPTISS